MDQIPLSGERLHEIEDHRGLQVRKRLRDRFEVQGGGNGNGLMAQGGQTPGDEIDLREDILFVPARPCGHLSVDDGDSHDPFPMRFRAERMIPAISSR